jgi:hypothetical protein
MLRECSARALQGQRGMVVQLSECSVSAQRELCKVTGVVVSCMAQRVLGESLARSARRSGTARRVLGEGSARALQGHRRGGMAQRVLGESLARSARRSGTARRVLGEGSARALQGHRCGGKQLLGGLVLMFSSLSKKTFIKLPIGQLPRRRRKLPTDSGPSCVLRWVTEMDLIGRGAWATRPSVSEMDLIGLGAR